MTMTKKLIQSKWETAVNKGNSKMKEKLKDVIFEDTNNKGFENNVMIDIRVNGKVYHLGYDRKARTVYSCFEFEKETGISISDFKEAAQLYSGSLREDLYEAIYSYTPEQKLELLEVINKLIGYKVKHPSYINGDLELVLEHPVCDKEYTICVPIENVVISERNNHK